jgi:hypothetical protein
MPVNSLSVVQQCTISIDLFHALGEKLQLPREIMIFPDQVELIPVYAAVSPISRSGAAPNLYEIPKESISWSMPRSLKSSSRDLRTVSVCIQSRNDQVRISIMGFWFPMTELQVTAFRLKLEFDW